MNALLSQITHDVVVAVQAACLILAAVSVVWAELIRRRNTR